MCDDTGFGPRCRKCEAGACAACAHAAAQSGSNLCGECLHRFKLSWFLPFLGHGVNLVLRPDLDGYQEPQYGLLTSIYLCDGGFHLSLAQLEDPASVVFWEQSVDLRYLVSIEGCRLFHPQQQPVTSLCNYPVAEHQEIRDWLKSRQQFDLLTRGMIEDDQDDAEDYVEDYEGFFYDDDLAGDF